jgi:hypothetical protein
MDDVPALPAAVADRASTRATAAPAQLTFEAAVVQILAIVLDEVEDVE